MTDNRLSGLVSFQALSGPLQKAVRLHLIFNVPAVEAMRAVGKGRNARRDWQQAAIQRVLTEYGNPDATEDYVARLAAIKAGDDKPAPVVVPEPPRPDPPPAPDPPPPTIEQEVRAAMEARRHDPDARSRAIVGQLFPGVGNPDDWAETSRRWEAEENAERDFLIRQYEERQRFNHLL